MEAISEAHVVSISLNQPAPDMKATAKKCRPPCCQLSSLEMYVYYRMDVHSITHTHDRPESIALYVNVHLSVTCSLNPAEGFQTTATRFSSQSS